MSNKKVRFEAAAFSGYMQKHMREVAWNFDTLRTQGGALTFGLEQELKADPSGEWFKVPNEQRIAWLMESAEIVIKYLKELKKLGKDPRTFMDLLNKWSPLEEVKTTI